MANPSLPRFITPLLLFVFILQASKISALDCHECASIEPSEYCKNKTLFENLVKNTGSKNETIEQLLGNFNNMTATLNDHMEDNATCLTYIGYAPKSDKKMVIRVMYNKIPKNLDATHCVEDPRIGGGKACFCWEDKCNDDNFDLSQAIKPDVTPLTVPLTGVPGNTNTTNSTNNTNTNNTNKTDATNKNDKNKSSSTSFTFPSIFLIVSSIILMTKHF